MIYKLRRHLIDDLSGGEEQRLIRELENEQECDLFDVLAELGAGAGKSRVERSAISCHKCVKSFPIHPKC